MVEAVNRLKTELEDGSVRLQDLTDLFSFILSLSSIGIERKQEREKIRKDCLDFANYYDKDVTPIQLYDNIIDLLCPVELEEMQFYPILSKLFNV